jgi:hypothetical protein
VDGDRLGMDAARRLAEFGVCRIARGLTAIEFVRVEQEYGFESADDHRAFLSEGLPVESLIPRDPNVYYAHDVVWPEWRDGDPRVLRGFVDWPANEVLRDVACGFGCPVGLSVHLAREPPGSWRLKSPGWGACPDQGSCLEPVKGIEPSLSAWETYRWPWSCWLTARWCCPWLTAADPWSSVLMAR